MGAAELIPPGAGAIIAATPGARHHADQPPHDQRMPPPSPPGRRGDRAVIPLVDRSRQYRVLRDDLEPALAEALAAGAYAPDTNVAAFEAEAARRLGVDHAVACASGADALRLALLAAGLGPGDEVVTPAFAAPAAAAAIHHIGATPVFADIDPATLNLDPAAAEAALTPRTRALLPAHTFGRLADMVSLGALARRRDLFLMEDATHAFGAGADGTAAGGFGRAAAFDLGPESPLGGFGDGGLVATGSATVAEQLRQLRDAGADRVAGWGSRLDELQAVVLRHQLGRLRVYAEARHRAARLYSELLADIPDIEPPAAAPRGTHAHQRYAVRSPSRAAVRERLTAAGIATAVDHAVTLPGRPAFGGREGDWPAAEAAAETVLSLPLFPELTKDEIHTIVDTLRETA
ncbi:MAG: DegT/DnrJ/EryC1/StrS family aminotransferase [Pseudomonadota bacterium]